jgi:hypothetical protein
MNKILVCILLAVVIGGCGIEKSFQPLPEPYEFWSKPGVTKLDIKKAMLECGMNVDGSGGGEPFDYNEYFLSELCMESQGYSDSFWTVAEGCRQHPGLPACQPGAVIPKPSVERRLNSEYCKSAREMISEEKYQRCIQVEAVDPLYSTTAEDCAYEYKDLRAECRP